MSKQAAEALSKDLEAIQEALRVHFPSLSDDELACAVLNLSQYLDEVRIFYDSLISDPERYAQFTELTASEPRATVKDGLDAPIPPNSSIHA